MLLCVSHYKSLTSINLCFCQFYLLSMSIILRKCQFFYLCSKEKLFEVSVLNYYYRISIVIAINVSIIQHMTKLLENKKKDRSIYGTYNYSEDMKFITRLEYIDCI